MKNKKIALAFVASVAIMGLWATSVFASMGQGNGQGQSRTDRTIVDTNDNGIADGQEDWDNDGIMNRDDADYEKSNANMRDDDNDGIPNKDDEDYVAPADGTGNQNGGKNANTGTKMGNGNSINQSEIRQLNINKVNQTKKNTYKTSINAKYGTLINKLDTEKLETINTKIDTLLENPDLSEETATVLVALKELIDEKIANDINLNDILN